MTPKQELYRLTLIMRHVKKLSPASRRWLLRRLADDERRDIRDRIHEPSEQ